MSQARGSASSGGRATCPVDPAAWEGAPVSARRQSVQEQHDDPFWAPPAKWDMRPSTLAKLFMFFWVVRWGVVFALGPVLTLGASAHGAEGLFEYLLVDVCSFCMVGGGACMALMLGRLPFSTVACAIVFALPFALGGALTEFCGGKHLSFVFAAMGGFAGAAGLSIHTGVRSRWLHALLGFFALAWAATGTWVNFFSERNGVFLMATPFILLQLTSIAGMIVHPAWNKFFAPNDAPPTQF